VKYPGLNLKRIRTTHMKKIKIVFYASGEIQSTYDPKCFLENFSGDLNEKCVRLLSHDDWRNVEADMYKVCEVSIPEWMNEHDYLNNHIQLRFNIAFGMPSDFSRIEFNNFSSLSERYRFFIGWLLKKYPNTKNAFMQSIVSQVRIWLATESNQYPNPLSPNQFQAAAKFCPLYEAEKISNKVYWANR
jgi:hypothetical protein